MGTMNFSIPDDVKDAFNELFKDDNKSAVVTELMRREIERMRLLRRLRANEEAFIERIRRHHEMCSREYTEDEIRTAREDGRP